MRYACLVWLIAGCGFSASASSAEDPGGSSAGSGSGTGGAGTSSGKCDVSDPGLRLCVSFGTHPMAQDLVTSAHQIVEATGVEPLANITLPILGRVVNTAGTFTASSQLRFKENPDFDVDDLTIDLWMSPQGKPAQDSAYWILDNNTEYYAAYDGDTTVRCGVAGTSVNSRAMLAPGSWHHVACTYGKADRLLRVYVDGDLGGCQMASAIPHNGMDGVAIGANYAAKNGFQQNFLGNLGDLHLYGTELAPDQICRAAGRTGCNFVCPGDGGGDPGGGR